MQAEKKKNIKKCFRGLCQGIFLIVILLIILRALFSFTHYSPEHQVAEGDNGFVALSYFGVALDSNEKLIGTWALEEQIQALQDSGYVTITQQDILDYYQEGKLLPERALFLMFEDGRRDTGIFAQKLLEKYNMIATMFGYGDKFEQKERKFLTGEELIELQESTFWELGTNGYRLDYINVFDENDTYFEHLTSREFAEITPGVERDYNHYLMDYIRDEYDVPTESYEGMVERIDWDYQKMKDVYTEAIGGLPQVYVLMHANTGQFATNDRVSPINEKWIYDLFSMNFNREGYSLNTQENAIYDMTRMQPQSYWSTNHLLMRIADDTKQDVAFVSGDTHKKEAWDILAGEVEMKDEQIILTSPPMQKGMMRLKGSEDFGDIRLCVALKGNKVGSQSVYIRADEALQQGIQVEVRENDLNIYRLNQGVAECIKTYPLWHSAEERNPIPLKTKGDRLLEIEMIDNEIRICIDQKEVIPSMDVPINQTGAIYLGAKPLEEIYSERNLTDDVYDGRFEAVVIHEVDMAKEDKILFDNRLKGVDKWLYEGGRVMKHVINWFIENL